MALSQAILSRKLLSLDYNDKYKTELCRNWMAGFCSFDNECVFAHGKEELRIKSSNLADPVPREPSPSLYATNKSSSTSSSSKKRLPIFIELSRGVQ